MHLYQHLCRCSIAMQCFLNENPDYWIFIPQRISIQEEQDQERELTTIDNHQYQFANDLPIPTDRNYQFNVQQKLKIEEFFQTKKYLHSPKANIDLYQAKLIAICK